ncbi:lamin tail domain-containing protein [Streptomyces chrestomyceticus]|uniref:lamin tail domain-containing protein n=1 Tax=Streptomyces chrestomyceticus TaxID=68185 RepID=UPI00340C674E
MSRSARLAAVALGSAALVTAAALPATAATGSHTLPAPHRSPVVIGAVQADSPGRDDGSNRSLNAEWITVKNTGHRPVNLKGWTLTSERTHKTYRFHNLRLGGRQEVRVHTGHGRDTWRDVFQNRRDYAWDNRRDTATLRNDRRNVVDTEHWGRHLR